MQVMTSRRLPDEDLVRLGVERVNANLDEAIAAQKRESPEQFSGGRHRATQPPGPPNLTVFDVQAARFEDMHQVYQSGIVMRAAGLYNVRSDYPNQVAGIFQILRDSFYSDLVGAKPIQDGSA
jgi:hypothetical protein